MEGGLRQCETSAGSLPTHPTKQQPPCGTQTTATITTTTDDDDVDDLKTVVTYEQKNGVDGGAGCGISVLVSKREERGGVGGNVHMHSLCCMVPTFRSLWIAPYPLFIQHPTPTPAFPHPSTQTTPRAESMDSTATTDTKKSNTKSVA